MATGFKITGLPAYQGTAIKGTDLLPVVYAAPDGITFTTQRATGIQVKEYIAGTITNQQLFETSTVNFRDITGEDITGSSSVTSPSGAFASLSSGNLTAININATNTTSISVSATSITAISLSATNISALSASFNTLTASSATFTSISSASISATSVVAISSSFTKLTATSASFIAVSSNAISATNIYINYEQPVPAVGKFVTTLSHIGSFTSTPYSIEHPFPTRHVIVQVYQVRPGDTESIKTLIGITNSPFRTVIDLTDPNNNIYDIIIIG